MLFRSVEILLDRHADINAIDQDKTTPLHVVARNGHHQCIELLLDRHADVNAADFNRNTPLHCASVSGHHQFIELLLDRHASIDAVNRHGDTALHDASRSPHRQCTELLLDRGASRSITNVRHPPSPCYPFSCCLDLHNVRARVVLLTSSDIDRITTEHPNKLHTLLLLHS